jgi:hypothetical protein
MQYEINPHKKDPADPIKLSALDEAAINVILKNSSELLKKT